MGAQLQVVGALGPLLIGTLVADWAALGTLIGTYSLAGVSSRCGGCCWRGSGTVSCCLAVTADGAGGPLALAPGFGMAVAGRCSARRCVAHHLGAKMVHRQVSGAASRSPWGDSLAWPIGIVVAQLVLAKLGADWRAGCGCRRILRLAFQAGRRVRGAAPTAPSAAADWLLRRMAAAARPRLSGRLQCRLAEAVGFAPAFLVSKGFSHAEAGASPADRHLHPAPAAHGVPSPSGGAGRARHRAVHLGKVAAQRDGRGRAALAHPAGLRLLAARFEQIMPRRVRVRGKPRFGMGCTIRLYLGLALLPPFAGFVHD